MSTNRMHRSNRLLRTIMAMLLIVAMTVQQGAYVLADETVPQPVTEASAPQTQAATEKHTEPAAPETKAPETAAPETRAAETAAPETNAPETKAPETAAPETKAAETAAPETAVPETKAPETKAAETAASKSETKAPETASTEKVRENMVSFAAAEGAKVYVDGKDVTNQKGTARDGKIIFKVVPETGYAIASVKVDDAKDARNTHNENEYIIEGIQTDNTVVRVTMNKVETEKATESETTADVKESKTETGKEYETLFSTTAHNVTITATTTDAAKFPEGTQLHADYAAPDTNLYQSAVQTVEQSLGISEDESLSAEGAVYDIYFTYNGERIEPDASVTVKMDFAVPVAADQSDAASLENGCIMHVADGQAENVTEAVRTTAKGAITDASFRSETFSPFFIGGIKRAPATEGQTDPNASQNLNLFTSEVGINGVSPDSKGIYKITKGTEYEVSLEFAEDPDGKQFACPLTYTLPEGFSAIEHTFDPFVINVTDGGISYSVSDNTVILQNGKLEVNFNENDPNWSHLKNSRNTEFYVKLKGTFDENAKEIDWGNSKKTSLDVNTSGRIATTKQAYYDPQDGKVHYTVTLTSHGYNTNIIAKDTLTGTALTYDMKTGVKLSPNKGTVSKETDHGFEYSIPEMKDGDTVTLIYCANVYFDVLGGGQGTEEQIGNSVVTTSKQQPNSDPVNNYCHIDYNTLSKSSGTVTDGTSGKKTIPWTITYNADLKGSAAGRTITDSISDSSRHILKYSGYGITVEVKDDKGTIIRTDKVAWADMNIDVSKAFSWTYKIPEDDKGKVYQYTVSYTTDADMSGLVQDTTVSNSVTDDKEHTGTGSAQIQPGADSKIGVKKEAGAHDSKEISWTVTLTVPKEGLTTAQLIDTFPTQYIGDQYYYDIWNDKSVTVTGLLDGEAMVKDEKTSDQTKAVYTFYQSADHSVTGLKGNGQVRTITVAFKTGVNQDWVNKKVDQAYMMEHKNTVAFIGNGQTVTSDATVEVTKHEISKKAEGYQTVLIKGEEYPAWKFVITIKGATVSDFDVTDTFDNRLRFVKPTENVGLDQSNTGKLSDKYNNIPWNAKNLSMTLDNIDSKVTFKVKKEDLQNIIKNNGNINELHIRYWLIVKDSDALHSIMKEAASKNDETTITNTATWGTNSDKIDVTYEYSPLTKKLLKDQSKLNTTDGSQPVAVYEIDANPAGAQIGDGTSLIVKDTMSANQVLNPQSVKFTPDEGTSYIVKRVSNGEQVITFTIPDKKAVKIEYSATVSGSGKQNLKNTAEMAGYTKESSASASKTTSAGGSGSVYSVKIFKYQEGDFTNKLSGCTFELHKTDENADTIWDGRGTQYTTGKDGVAVVKAPDGAHWGLNEGTQYYLIEKVAPEGYQLDSTRHYFTISKDGSKNESQNIYMNGETISISNKQNTYSAKGEAKFSAEKVLNGAALKGDEFEFVLKDVVCLRSVVHTGRRWDDIHVHHQRGDPGKAGRGHGV